MRRADISVPEGIFNRRRMIGVEEFEIRTPNIDYQDVCFRFVIFDMVVPSRLRMHVFS